MLIIALILVLLGALILFKKPKHDRNWELEHSRLPRIDIGKSEISVDNFRDFDWQDDGKTVCDFKKEKFNLNDIVGMDMVMSYFFRFRASAHIFFIYRFLDNHNMAISVEFRRRADKKFSYLWPVWGLLRNFEIIYVVGSERDIVGLRTDIRKEKVCLYPLSISSDKVKELLLAIFDDINNIYKQPSFYNTISNNCANVVTDKMAKVLKIKLPFSYKILLPGYIDEILYKLKLIPIDKSFEETRNYHLIDNNKVNKDSADYSRQIRKH